MMMQQIKASKINQSDLKGSIVEKTRKTLKKVKPSFLQRFQGKRQQIGKQGLMQLLKKRSHNDQPSKNQLFDLQQSNSHRIKIKTEVIDQEQILRRFRNQREPKYHNFTPLGNLELLGSKNMMDEDLKAKSERINLFTIKKKNNDEERDGISKVKRFKTNDDGDHRRYHIALNQARSASQLPEIHHRHYKPSGIVLSQPSSPRPTKYAELHFLTKQAKVHLRHLQLFEKKLHKVQRRLQDKP